MTTWVLSKKSPPMFPILSAGTRGCGEGGYEEGGECQIEEMVDWEKDGWWEQSVNMVEIQ